MNKLIGLFILCMIFSCEPKPVKKESNASNSSVSDSFVINGRFDNYFSEYVYLNKIMLSSLKKLDSAKITDNSFTFSGAVSHPERFALTFDNSSAMVVFIIENIDFQIELDARNPSEPIITNSPLNDELNHYKNHSKEIFREIDKLYPRFQKARLENDVETLDEIGMAMQEIENRFRNYSYNYVATNPKSYVSAMILRDLIQSDKADMTRIGELFNQLSDEIKEIPDAQLVAIELELAKKG